MTAVAVADAPELRALLRDRRGRVRLQGTGTRGPWLPPPPADVQPVSLERLDAIARLEPDDLTCSVGPGLPMAALQAELQRRRLELGITGGGTVGGLFAADPLGPAVPGGPAPRSLLLGLEGMLADGTAFKSGARVVKSVAGYDVHRLFPGSRGTLFAATLLHLKLRPAPRCTVAFASAPGARDELLPRFRELLQGLPALRRLVLAGTAQAWCVRGLLAGHADAVAAALRARSLAEAPEPGPDHLDPLAAAAAGCELLVGIVRPSRLGALLGILPASAPVIAHAGGHFEAALAPATASQVLAALPGLEAAGAICSSDSTRHGRGTAPDPGADRLQQAIRKALDPAQVFG